MNHHAGRACLVSDQIRQLTTGQLDGYASQLARCLKALATTAPIRMRVQDELAAVYAEQEARAAAEVPADPRRQHDVGGLANGELKRIRRELAASLALTRPDSPARTPILAHLAAIDVELDARAAARPSDLPGSQVPTCQLAGAWVEEDARHHSGPGSVS